MSTEGYQEDKTMVGTRTPGTGVTSQGAVEVTLKRIVSCPGNNIVDLPPPIPIYSKIPIIRFSQM